MKKMHQKWLDVSIKAKTSLLMGASLLAMWVIVLIVILQLQTFTQQSSVIMDEYQDITGFMDAFSAENVCLEIFVPPAAPSNARDDYLYAINESDNYLKELKPNSRLDQHEVFMLKQAINNAMEYYRFSQKQLLETEDYEQLMAEYLSLKTQAAYIDQYSRNLLDISMAYGGEQWQQIEAANTRATNQLLALISFGTLLLGMVLLLFIRYILKPLDELSRAADAISAGRYNEPPLLVQSRDELGRTAHSFNLMQTEIRRTIHALEKQAEMEKHLLEKEVEAAQMQQMLQEGRFAQLQSQINPHFLFNTLNTIAAMAREEHATLSEDLILRLSSFFRYSLESDEKLVPLRREIQLLRDYIELQETRYGDRITMEIQSAPELESVVVPKFILQPLVENSIVHGLRERVDGGIIRVRTCRGRRGINIYVTDNGCGFHVEQQCRTNGPRRSVGLVNIAERMAFSGGHLTVFSRPGLGTCIRITVGEASA